MNDQIVSKIGGQVINRNIFSSHGVVRLLESVFQFC